MPTIHEDDEERDADELIVENFYAELMSSDPMADLAFKEWLETMNPSPVQMMTENTILFMAKAGESYERSNVPLESAEVYLYDTNENQEIQIAESDEIGPYVELCFTMDMAPIVLDEDQYRNMYNYEVATMRVYISQNTKRAVVVKEDDLLSKRELQVHARDVASATITELKTWLDNRCFKKCLLKNAQNVMTSRYVAKWKWIKNHIGQWHRVIRMRLCLRLSLIHI